MKALSKPAFGKADIFGRRPKANIDQKFSWWNQPAKTAGQAIRTVVESGPSETWTLSTSTHTAVRAGKHIDLRLIDPQTDRAHSWALPRAKMPGPGEQVLAIPQPVHSAAYALRRGEWEIPSGYGQGKVKSDRIEPVEIVSARPTKIKFNTHGRRQQYVLVSTRTGALLRNITQGKKMKKKAAIADRLGSTLTVNARGLIKQAISRWKRKLIEGGLSAASKRRLTPLVRAHRKKLVSGLTQGTENILKSHGYAYNVVRPTKGVRARVSAQITGLLDKLRTAGNLGYSGPDAIDRVAAATAASRGGAAFIPAWKRVVVDPKSLASNFGRRLSSSTDKELLTALAGRHEADEIRLLARKGVMDYFVSRKPKSLGDKFDVGAYKWMREALKRVKRTPLKGPVRGAVDAMLAAGKQPMGLAARKGRMLTGVHVDPQVLVRESQNLTFMPNRVRRAVRAVRKGSGDVGFFSQAGADYGRATPTRGKDVRRVSAAIAALAKVKLGQ